MNVAYFIYHGNIREWDLFDVSIRSLQKVSDCKIVHSWLYANNLKREIYPVFFDQGLQLGVCGDWCVGGRIEGAFTAAFDLVEKIKKRIL